MNKLVFILLIIFAPFAMGSAFTEKKSVHEFIQHMVSKHKFNQQQLLNIFNAVEPSKKVIKHISKPFEDVCWERYQKHFITTDRIQQGVKFWKNNLPALSKAEKIFKVPAELIVSIIGIETFYGKYIGEYPVLQSLATLAFNYPPREKFFKQELEQYLLLSQEQNFNPLHLKGSYAGAMGTPQFIASSYRKYAADFDNSGQIDLINNTEHAIASVANYLKIHGWKYNKPIAKKANVKGKLYLTLQKNSKNNPKPLYTPANLAKYNIHFQDNNHDAATQLSFLELGDGYKKEHWLGYNNFYVITRYNHSIHYAMAVYVLSERIKSHRK